MTRPSNKADTPRRRSSARWRYLAAIPVLIVLLLAAGVGLFLANFNPNRYAPQIIAAVDQATGRQLTLGGPITLRLSLFPTLQATDIRLSNPPGYAAQDLVSIKRVEAQVALLPLLSHRIDILRLVLISPSVALERDKAGTGNWVLTPAKPAQPRQPLTPQAAASARAKAFAIALKQVDIRDATLRFGPANDPRSTIHIASFTGRAGSLSAPLHISAAATLGTAALRLTGVVGPLERFSGVGSGPWPVNLTAQFAGAMAHVTGTVAEPRSLGGYDLTADLSVPDLSALGAALPPALAQSLNLPALQDLKANAQFSGTGATLPAVSRLSLSAGPSDLSAWRQGLTLTSLSGGASALDQPFTLTAQGTLGPTPFNISAKLGALRLLLAPAPRAGAPPRPSFPIDLTATLGNARASITGAIATPRTLSGTALALKASIPDLSTLSAAMGTSLPSWKNINAQGTLIDLGGNGLLNAVGLDGLTLTMDHAAIAGDASLIFKPHPDLQLSLNATSIDADALRAAMPTTSPAPSPAPAAKQAGPARLIPALPLPLGLLRAASANITLNIDQLIWNKATYSALQLQARLAQGRLTLSPVSAQLPGGTLQASAGIDATANPATETMHLKAPALALAPLLRMAGLPAAGTQGTVQAQLNASSQGNDLRAIAAHLTGQLGLASVNDNVNGALLARFFAPQQAGLTSALTNLQGPVPLRCAALRLDMKDGQGTLRALTLDSSRLRVLGGGGLNTANETLALTLHPQIRLGSAWTGLPVHVGGSFAAPRLSPVAGSSAASQPSSLLGGLLGALTPGPTNTANDVCPAALKLARMGASGPMPASSGTPPSGGTTAPQTLTPQNLLNTLLNK